MKGGTAAMPQLRIDNTHRLRGICLSMLSTLLFGVMQSFARLTGPEITVFEQSFFCSLTGAFIAAAVLKWERLPLFGDRRYHPLLLARSAAGYMGLLLSFYAARNAAQADITILMRTAMFMITAASVVLFHERMNRMYVPVMLLAFAGAFIAANPKFDSSSLPLLAAFGCAFTNTVAYILVSYFSGRVHPLSVVMAFFSFSAVAAVPLMWGSFVLPSGWSLFCLAVISLCYSLAQILMTYSYRLLPAGEISVYNQSAIFFNAIWGYVFLGEMPGPRTIVGGALVMAASVLLFLSKRQAANETD